MLAVLVAGHITNDLGVGQTIKSVLGWAKGWALLGLYPFAGAVLSVRSSVVYRAICRLAVQTLILLPFMLVAPMIGLPGKLYVSPLSVLGGSGPEFFVVMLYIIDPENGARRWQFYAPWAPAAGMVAVVHMICALQDRDRGRRIAGLAANLAISWFSASRMAIIATAVIWPVTLFVSRLNRSWTWFACAPLVLLGAFSAPRSARWSTRRWKGSRARGRIPRGCARRWGASQWNGGATRRHGSAMVLSSAARIWSNTCPSAAITAGMGCSSSRGLPGWPVWPRRSWSPRWRWRGGPCARPMRAPALPWFWCSSSTALVKTLKCWAIWSGPACC
jgi:hypothetical protein